MEEGIPKVFEGHAQLPSQSLPFFDQVPIASDCPSIQRFSFDLEHIGHLLRSGVIIVNQRRAILMTNRSAVSTLADGDGMRIAMGSLMMERAYIQRSFEALLQQIHAAAQLRFDAEQWPCTGVPDRKGAIRYVLRVIDAHRRGNDTALLLTLTDLVDRVGPTRTNLATVFKMSNREAELAELFGRGFHLDEIALRMCVSLNTARVHLRNVFEKTNCSGQSELMRVISRLA